MTLLVLVAGIAAPHRAIAQAPPLLSADIAVGTMSGRGGEYRDRGLSSTRFGTHARAFTVAAIHLLLTAEGERAARTYDLTDICLTGSQGQCVPPYPEFWGWTLGVAARRSVVDRVVFTVGASTGAYRTTSGTNRQAVDRYSRGRAFQADVAYRLSDHYSLLVSKRYVRVQNIEGNALSFAPLSIGLRLQ